MAAGHKLDMYGIREKYVRLQEIPFSSEQKFMAVKCVPKFCPQSMERFYVKGAIEKVISQCTKYMYNDQIVPLNADKSLQYFKEAQLMGRKGLRGKNTCKSLNPNKM